MGKSDTHRIRRNGILAVLSYDYFAFFLIVADDVVFRVHALDVVFLRHVDLRCCIGLLDEFTL